MSTNSKNCPPPRKTQPREKPATSPPLPVPEFAKIPCPRDQRAYALHLKRCSQRWIAARLKCAQPTVLKGIRRMEKWLATTLPEDRGEYTATEKLRLALARHERLMEGVIKSSLREFRRSRQTISMKKTVTTTETKNKEGEKVKIRVEEWEKPQIGRKGLLDSAAQASHEVTVLAAGWLGPGNGSMSMAKVMDPEERDRWGRMVDRRDAKIKELQESVPELENRLLPPREESATVGPASVSQGAEKEPEMYRQTAVQCVTTFSRPTAYAIATDTARHEKESGKTGITLPPP